KSPMAAVARIQELCGLIVDFLDTSVEDLRSTSVVSRSFRAPSQALLFREVIVVAKRRGPSAERLSRLLESAPHLIPFIRCLGLPIDSKALGALSGIQFVGLREIELVGGETECPLTLVQRLIAGIPALRRLSLTSVVRRFEDFRELFDNLPPTLKHLCFNTVFLTGPVPSGIFKGQKSSIESMQLVNSPALGDWFIHPASPFDVSRLADVYVYGSWSEVICRIIQASRKSIVRLRLEADIIALYLDLSQFPHLACIEIMTNEEEDLQDVKHLFSGLSPDNTIETIILQISDADRNFDLVKEIDTAIASTLMPVLREVEVKFIGFNMDPEPGIWCLPKLASKGVLTTTVVNYD
ncbi:hypothetical protein B0H11DRAFT_1996003, partial [Mycena galericulata]